MQLETFLKVVGCQQSDAFIPHELDRAIAALLEMNFVGAHVTSGAFLNLPQELLALT